MPTDPSKLTPANPEMLADTLAHALVFSGKKRPNDADQFMARIVAKRLVEHLRMCGYVVMSCEPTKPHSTP
jgi:hypothetical protein